MAGELDGSTNLTRNGQAVSGKLSAIAHSHRQSSIVSSLGTLGHRIGRGNASWFGSWAVVAIVALLLIGIALGGLAVACIDRAASAPSRVPMSAKAVTGAALAVGLSWAMLTPPFQVPDEISHVAYVQYLSEAGRLPLERPDIVPFSPEERELLGALGFSRVIGRVNEKVLTSSPSEQNLRRVEDAGLDRRGGGNATTASANPPLYYALQAPIYLATSGGSLLTSLFAMRLLSVLFMSLSVFFAFMFVRELLPGSPWTWTAGGLACAFQPVLGFVGAGVNPDSLLFLCATTLFFCLARILRRGLTAKRAACLGLAVMAGLLTKPLFFALVPVAGLGLGLAAWRLRRGWAIPVATAIGLVAVPVGLWIVIGSVVFDHPYFAVAASVASGPGDTATTYTSHSKEASFILQLFLPRLPFLADLIPGVPIHDIWITGLVGVFGWVDYGFGPHAIEIGTRVFELLLILMLVALVRNRAAVAASWPLALCCLAGVAAIPLAVGITDYDAYITGAARFEQARYLLPLLALYAGLFGLASKAFSRRAAQIVVPGLWALVALHTVAAMALTVSRYYV